MANINRVTITGNLTRDPELRRCQRHLGLCAARRLNGRRRTQQTEQWEDEPNYFDVTVWGAQGENCSKYLAKGRRVAIDGRLQWREWTSRGTEPSGCRYSRRERAVPRRS